MEQIKFRELHFVGYLHPTFGFTYSSLFEKNNSYFLSTDEKTENNNSQINLTLPMNPINDVYKRLSWKNCKKVSVNSNMNG